VEAYAGALNLKDLPGERCSCLMRKTSSVREKQGAFDQALESLQQAQECVQTIAEQDEGRRELGRIWIERGAVHYKMGEVEKAEEEIRRGLDLLEDSGASANLAAGYHYLGIVHRSRGDYDSAVQMHTRSLKLREEINDRWGIALSYNNLGIAYKNQGKKDLAVEMYQRCLEIFEQIGYRLGVAGLYNNLGSLAQDKGDYHRAREMFQRSMEIRQEIGNRHGVAMSLTNLGLVSLECGQHDRAREILDESLDLQKELGLGDFESITCSYLSQACCRMDRLQEAAEMADEALTLAVAAGQRGNEGLARRVWGEVRTQMASAAGGEERAELIESAGLELGRSREIFEELGMEQEIGRTLLDLARLHRLAERPQEARESAGKARDMFRGIDAQGDLKQAEEILDSLSEEG